MILPVATVTGWPSRGLLSLLPLLRPYFMGRVALL
jgi:hypothetical protein